MNILKHLELIYWDIYRVSFEIHSNESNNQKLSIYSRIKIDMIFFQTEKVSLRITATMRAVNLILFTITILVVNILCVFISRKYFDLFMLFHMIAYSMWLENVFFLLSCKGIIEKYSIFSRYGFHGIISNWRRRFNKKNKIINFVRIYWSNILVSNWILLLVPWFCRHFTAGFDKLDIGGVLLALETIFFVAMGIKSDNELQEQDNNFELRIYTLNVSDSDTS